MYGKIKRKISGIGLKNTIYFIAKRFKDTLFHSRDMLFRVDLLTYYPDERYINIGVEVKDKRSFEELTEVEKQDIKDYGGGKLLALFKKRFQRGHWLFLAYINEEVVGANWVFKGGFQKIYVIPQSVKEFTCFATFTIDKYRRKGVSTTLFINTLKMLKQEGYLQGYVSTKEWNVNQKAVIKAGFEYVGKYRKFKFFAKNILIWSSTTDPDS